MGKDKVCEGFCGERWNVNDQPGGCDPYYEWTWDGVPVGGNESEVTLDDEWGPGPYTLCVTAFIGNEDRSSICDEEGPKCKTITILPKPEYKGPDKYICLEDVPYDWHGTSIFADGEYKVEFTGANCCKYDSIRQFYILPKPDEPNVYYIGCDPGDTYIDPTTNKRFSGCNNYAIVDLPNSTSPNRCDSAYHLYTIYPRFAPSFQLECLNGEIYLYSNITDITDYCGNNTDVNYSFDYKWYSKKNPARIIGQEENLDVTNLGKDDYCLELSIQVSYGDASELCIRTFCETLDESKLKPGPVNIVGDTVICLGHSAHYQIDTILSDVILYNWIVIGGVITTKDPFNSASIDVLWNGAPGKGTVCFSYQSSCGVSPETCLEVELYPAPNPNAGPNDSICSLINQFNARQDVGGSWKQICGPGTSNLNSTDPKSNVDVSQYGKYCFEWTETRQGCTTKDTVELWFNSDPNKDKEVIICAGDNNGYTYNFKITGGSPKYRVLKGNGTIDSTTNVYTSKYVKNLVDDTVMISDAFGCQFTFILNHECKCTNAIGKVNSVSEDLCEDGILRINPDIYDPNGQMLDAEDTVMFFIYTDPLNPLGSIVRYISGNTVSYDPRLQYGQQYYIGAILGRRDNKGGIDRAGGCLRESYGKPFTFYEYPRPDAGQDDAVCGLVYDLRGLRTSSIPNSQLKWRVTGGGGVVFSNTDVETPTVTAQGGYGTYSFEIEETNNQCVRTDVVNITFNAPPEIDNIEKICVDKNVNFTYRVEATIKSGKGPYTLLTGGGKLVGNLYMSDTLVSLDTFKILVQDANGCVSELVADIHNCNCGIISAGDLEQRVTRVCEDQCVTITEVNPDTIVAGEDIRMYILSNSQTDWKGANTTTVLYDTFYTSTAQICFDASRMKTEQIYYLIKVVGNDLDNNNLVDDDDDCFRISSQPFVWTAYPLADAGKADSVCGLNYVMQGNLTLGQGSWRQIGGPSPVVITDPRLDNTGINVSQKGTYMLEWTVDNQNCVRKDTVHISFWDSPNFKGTPVIECDNTAENYRFTIGVENGESTTWSVEAYRGGTVGVVMTQIQSGVYQSGWIPTGSSVELSVRDRHICSTDTTSLQHECVCITDIGDLDLTPIILCADGTARAQYDGSTGMKDGNDVVRYVLYDGQSNDPLNGTIIGFNDNGVFVFDGSKMQLGKTYYIAVFMGNVDPVTGNVNYGDRCIQNTPGVPVTWYAYPVAEIKGSKILSCKVKSIDLDGRGSLAGSAGGLDYTWSTIDGGFVNPGQVNGSTVEINKKGTYRLSIKDQVSGCTNEITYTISEDITLPVLSVATPQELTCEITQVALDASKSSQGVNYEVEWKGSSVVTNARSYIGNVSSPGSYTVVVTNLTNGCVDSTTVQVSQDIKTPSAKIVQKGTLTCSVDQVKLDGSGSQGASGQVKEYNWRALSGSIVSGQGSREITVGKPGGEYVLEIKDGKNGCLDYDTIRVSEVGNPLALISTEGKNPRCYGEKNGVVSILEVLDYNNQVLSGLMFSINGGQYVSADEFPNLGQGTYKISVKDANGCLRDTTVTLVEPSPMGIEVVKTIVVDQGTRVDLDSMVLDVSGGTEPYKSNEWYNTSIEKDWTSNKVYTADTSYEFRVTAVDASGCEITELVRVLVKISKDVWWPNVISANGDKINDYFNVYGKRVRIVKSLAIYDRWGEQVYKAENLLDANKGGREIGWNGSFRGELVMPGVYVFVADIEFEGSSGSEIYKGDFTVIR